MSGQSEQNLGIFPKIYVTDKNLKCTFFIQNRDAVLRIRIRIRIRRIRMFLGLLDPDPDPLVRGMDQNPDPDPDSSIIKQK